MALSCDPETLAAASKCFNCFDEGQKLNVLIYLFTQVAGVTTDPQTLAVASKCFQCIPEGNKMNVLLYLACNFGGGGAGGGSVSCGAGAPVAAPSGTCALYIDSNDGTLYLYYGGAWH